VESISATDEDLGQHPREPAASHRYATARATLQPISTANSGHPIAAGRIWLMAIWKPSA
jgi:hypothetical protein